MPSTAAAAAACAEGAKVTLRELKKRDRPGVKRITAEDAAALQQSFTQDENYADLVLTWGSGAFETSPLQYAALGVEVDGKLVGYIGRFHVDGPGAMGGRFEWPKGSTLKTLLHDKCIPTRGSTGTPTCVVSWSFLKAVPEDVKIEAVRKFLDSVQTLGVGHVVVLLQRDSDTAGDVSVAERLGFESQCDIKVMTSFLKSGSAGVWLLSLPATGAEAMATSAQSVEADHGIDAAPAAPSPAMDVAVQSGTSEAAAAAPDAAMLDDNKDDQRIEGEGEGNTTGESNGKSGAAAASHYAGTAAARVPASAPRAGSLRFLYRTDAD